MPVDFASIVHQTVDWNLSKLTRSTVPLLDYWRDFETRIEALFRELGLESSANSVLSFEFPVPSSEPQNKPSFTDLMYYDNAVAVAIEGKWTEDIDKSVRLWLEAGKERKRREDVLNHWLGLINSYSAEVDQTRILDIPYQLVHRTASACFMGKSRTFVVVQIFKPAEHLARHRHALDCLVEAINPNERLEVWLHTVQTAETDLYRDTETKLAQTSIPSDNPTIVRAALLTGHLFHFGEESFERIAKK